MIRFFKSKNYKHSFGFSFYIHKFMERRAFIFNLFFFKFKLEIIKSWDSKKTDKPEAAYSVESEL